jgi:mono/diheme cytochrome c family protein
MRQVLSAECGVRIKGRLALVTVMALAMLLAIEGGVEAGECRVVVRSHAAHRAHGVYAPFALFQVGSALREEPIAERAAEIALARFLARIEAADGDGALQPSTLKPGPSTLVRRSCVSCHGGAAPKAGLDLSNLAALSAGQRLKAVARVVSDEPARRMPPGKSLAPAEIGEVLQELSGSE